MKRVKKLAILRRLQIALAPYVLETEIVAADDIVLRCRLDEENEIKIPADKAAKRLCSLIQKLEPSILSGRVKIEDLKLVIWALYSPISALYPHRSKIREVTGLLRKEPKLMKYLIWKRVKASERAKNPRIKK